MPVLTTSTCFNLKSFSYFEYFFKVSHLLFNARALTVTYLKFPSPGHLTVECVESAKCAELEPPLSAMLTADLE